MMHDGTTGIRGSVSERPGRGIRRIDLTDVQLASSETARRINRDIVLEVIRISQPISRADIARRSGLQRSTVSQIVEQLIRENWVREGPLALSLRGRRPTLVVLNQSVVAIAVDIHPKQATVAAVDLSGNVLSRVKRPLTLDPVSSTNDLVDSVAAVAKGMPGKSVEGIGISLPGRVDPENHRLIFAPNLQWSDQWSGFDLKRVIESKLSFPVTMENAATACLLAELTFARMDGIRDAVLVTVSEGVGAGIFANGHLISGHHGMAGEFGHISMDPTGPRCACGQNGCWEMFASCQAVLRYYYEFQPEAEPVTFLELLNLAEEGDLSATKAIEKQAGWIGRGLRTIVAGLSPRTILIAGEVVNAWHRYGPVIEKVLLEAPLAGSPPQIRPTLEGEVARLLGAAALVFQRGPLHQQAAPEGNLIP